MRVLFLDLGDMPRDARLSLLRILPRYSQKFANVVVPHHCSRAVRYSVYPQILKTLKEHSYFVRWRGAYGLDMRLVHRRDCSTALVDAGIDDYDDCDDAFSRRSPCLSDRATALRVLDLCASQREAISEGSATSPDREAVCVRLMGRRAAPGTQDQSQRRRDEVPEDAGDPIDDGGCKQTAEAKRQRREVTAGGPPVHVDDVVYDCDESVARIVNQIVLTVDADFTIAFTSGFPSADGTLAANVHDACDVLATAAVWGHGVQSLQCDVPVSIGWLMDRLQARLSGQAMTCAPSLTCAGPLVTHGHLCRHVVVEHCGVTLRVLQQWPFCFHTGSVHVFAMERDPNCTQDLASSPDWMESDTAKALSKELSQIARINDHPFTSNLTLPSTHIVHKTRVVASFTGLLPRTTFESLADAGGSLRAIGGICKGTHVLFERRGPRVIARGAWVFVGPAILCPNTGDLEHSLIRIKHE